MVTHLRGKNLQIEAFYILHVLVKIMLFRPISVVVIREHNSVVIIISIIIIIGCCNN